MNEAIPRDRLQVPPRRLLPSPPDDPVDYYYRRLTGPLYRRRLELAVDLLGDRPFDSLLEVGYGSGILLPELARRTSRLVAVDVHEAQAAVGAMLGALGLDAELQHGDIRALPFADGEFDALVCLSVLEHLTDPAAAAAEIARVLGTGGVAVLGFPVRNPATDAFFRLVGYSPREIHPASHSDILRAAAAEPRLVVERRLHFPRLLPMPLSAYVVCRCRAA